jgi:hypothetical protein
MGQLIGQLGEIDIMEHGITRSEPRDYISAMHTLLRMEQQQKGE